MALHIRRLNEGRLSGWWGNVIALVDRFNTFRTYFNAVTSGWPQMNLSGSRARMFRFFNVLYNSIPTYCCITTQIPDICDRRDATCNGQLPAAQRVAELSRDSCGPFNRTIGRVVKQLEHPRRKFHVVQKSPWAN